MSISGIWEKSFLADPALYRLVAPILACLTLKAHLVITTLHLDLAGSVTSSHRSIVPNASTYIQSASVLNIAIRLFNTFLYNRRTFSFLSAATCAFSNPSRPGGIFAFTIVFRHIFGTYFSSYTFSSSDFSLREWPCWLASISVSSCKRCCSTALHVESSKTKISSAVSNSEALLRSSTFNHWFHSLNVTLFDMTKVLPFVSSIWLASLLQWPTSIRSLAHSPNSPCCFSVGISTNGRHPKTWRCPKYRFLPYIISYVDFQTRHLSVKTLFCMIHADFMASAHNVFKFPLAL